MRISSWNLARSIPAVMVIVLLLATLSASPVPQDAPLSSGIRPDETAAPRLTTEQTPYQKLVDRLKLDPKTQVPAVDAILMAAGQEAAPVGQQMLELRQALVNASLQNKADAMKPAVDAYAAAAARMAAIEAHAFAKIYATLKPNQQANAPQAFAIMAGMFQPPLPRAGGRGARRGGGPL